MPFVDNHAVVAPIADQKPRDLLDRLLCCGKADSLDGGPAEAGPYDLR
jgi:hypothetical protein